MPKIIRKTYLEDTISSDEDDSLNTDTSKKRISVPKKQEILDNGNSDNLVLEMQYRGRECHKWICIIAILLFAAFLLAEYISSSEMNLRNTSKFIENVKALKTFHTATYPQSPSLAGSAETAAGPLKNKPVHPLQAQQQKISLNSNLIQLQLNQQTAKSIQTTSSNSGEDSNDQNKGDDDGPRVFVPNDENYAQTLPGEMQRFGGSPAATANNLNQPDENSEQSLQPSSTVLHGNAPAPALKKNQYAPSTDSPSSLTQPQPQPQPQSSPIGSSGLTPTIKPFNILKTALIKKNGFNNFASITNQHLIKVRRFKTLVQGDIFAQNDLSNDQRSYYESTYSVSKYEELPFCIVVPTFNNIQNQRHIKNIKSIVMQEYANYHIVVIDDASEDETGTLIEKFLNEQQKVPKSRYNVIKNSKRQRAMANLRNAAKNYCKPQEIFMIVDGDDELLGRQVLKVFNAVFQEKKLWFVYSNFLTVTGAIGFSRPFPTNTIKGNSYRSYPFVTSHLRAFYTKLFLNIKEEDLKDGRGEYFKAANDVAICLPILEQSHERVGYLPEMTYYYNSNTGLNNHQIRLSEQRGNDRLIRSKKSYKPLQNLLE